MCPVCGGRLYVSDTRANGHPNVGTVDKRVMQWRERYCAHCTYMCQTYEILVDDFDNLVRKESNESNSSKLGKGASTS